MISNETAQDSKHHREQESAAATDDQRQEDGEHGFPGRSVVGPG
jgi:hypothetical protein